MPNRVLCSVMIAAVLAPALPALAAPPTPRVVKTKFPTDDLVIATLVLPAPKDDRTDMTAAVQAAVDTVARAGGGVVFLPAGRYRFDGRLVLKESVTLRGDWPGRDAAKAGQGTLLMPCADRGKADAPPFVTMERGTGVRNLAVWYPEQSPDKIVPYPWTFRTSATKTGNNITIQNATLVNPYQAIKIGPEWNELHTIRNVVGTPLMTGIWMDMTTDIGRLIDVDFDSAYWLKFAPPPPPAPGKLPVWGKLRWDKGIAFDIGRSDWEYMDGIQAEGCSIGLRTREGNRGAANAVVYGGEFEYCNTAVLVESLNPVGLSLYGCTLDGYARSLRTGLGMRSVVLLSHSDIWSVARRRFGVTNLVLLEGPGAAFLQACGLPNGNEQILARAGSLSVLNSRFRGAGVAVELGEKVRYARLCGNYFGTRGKAALKTASSGDVAYVSSYLPTDVPHAMKSSDAASRTAARNEADPRPGLADLFVVTDHGASPKLTDNTPAFAKALAAAKAAGGGTVYVPAGNYRMAGSITVPTGVELRGCWDVPHHTVSGGSVLMPTGGRGKEDAAPFIQMQAKSGLRGFTVWYPEQSIARPVAYPWAVRGLGAGCWIVNVTIANAWQGVDFWTHESTGHYISYLAGAMFRRGLFVSKCDGPGWVEDVQFNPHYMARAHPSLPKPRGDGEGGGFGQLVDFQRKNLEGLVFGRCKDEMIRRTFLYAAWDGLAFRDDGGGANAVVINHGTDTGSRALLLDKVGPKGVRMYNTQLVPLGKYEVGAIVATKNFDGRVEMVNTQIWGGATSGVLDGTGTILLEQLNTLCGPFVIKGGSVRIQGGYFQRNPAHHVIVEKGVEHVELLANLAKDGEFRVLNQAGGKLYARANSLALPGLPGRSTLATGWEAGEVAGPVDTVQREGGGLRGVSKATCRPVATAEAHAGKRALRLAGQADDAEHSYVYMRIFDGPIVVQSDSDLTYWLRPGNERSRCVGVDLLFARGATLRDAGVPDAAGRNVHPAQAKGAVGKWTRIRIPLAPLAGRTIAAVMAAYDGRGGAGPIEAMFDDVAITSALAAGGSRVQAKPEPGRVAAGTRVELRAPGTTNSIRYTLTGLSPTKDSPRYTQPIVLDKPGLWELRCVAEHNGRPTGPPRALFYEVAPKP